MKNINETLSLKRYDFSADKSLRPHSAADEYLLDYVLNLKTKPGSLAIYNDRFGFLTCYLSAYTPTVIATHKSQEIAIELNLKANKLPKTTFQYPLTQEPKKEVFAIMKAPKSLELFQLFLEHIKQQSTDDATVVISFMTRHFSPKLIRIASQYFEVANQSKALKKARLLILSKKRKTSLVSLLNTLEYKGQFYKQYWGVFSAKHIDYATQYFLQHLELKTEDKDILDLASGNGVIAKTIHLQKPLADVHLLDDSYLAVESAKLNINGKNIHHHYANDLSIFEENTFDLIVTNPPFHFEYEVNIQIAIRLFKSCFQCLKTNGNLQVVANKHLNYITHLQPIFSSVVVLAENEKFSIYKCNK